MAEQAGLNITLSETPKTGFVATQPISSHSRSEFPNFPKEFFFILVYSADPDEMLYHTAFHLVFHYLPNYLFGDFQYTKC